MIRAGYFMREPRVFRSPRLIRDPQVSVILPTFCRGDNGLLERAINSVLSQSFSSFELIVVDDGSTDATADLVAAYVKSDDRIIYIRHDTNCGLPALRVNEGLLMARGDLCAYQFDDDQWVTTFLATMSGALVKSPGFQVAYGLCRLSVPGGQQMLGGPFDYSRLMTENYIANNSLIHRRRVFEELGGYDMHLVMRRLCDWDLWLRWGRHTPFLFVDEVVSMVEARRPESIGKTCIADGFAMRAHMALDRGARLRPDALASYVVDDLDHLKHLGTRKLESLWRQQVAPYLSRFRHIWIAVRPPNTKPLHVLVSKSRYDSSFEIAIGNFAAPLAGDFAFTFVPESQTDEAAIRCADVLLLQGATDQQAARLAEIARRQGKAVIYLMNDDLMPAHEIAEERRHALESVIRGADLVITYSRPMQESTRELNARSVVLEPSIRGKWLASAKSKLNQPLASETAGSVKIGFSDAETQREEFAILWAAIMEASRHLGVRAEFHFWGITPVGLEDMQSVCHCQPLPSSYEQYLGCLASGGFDVMLAPFFAEGGAGCAQWPDKFLEITTAGAVGVYSDVESYRAVMDGVNGIKCQNTVESWSAAILKAAYLLPGERKGLIAQAIQTIERDYTSEAQAPHVAATLEAAVLHSLLNRTHSGKARIGYFCHSPFLSGVGDRLLGYASLAQAFGFEPILILPSGVGGTAEVMQQRATALGIAIAYLPLKVETEIDVSRQLDESTIGEIRRWLWQNRIGLIHSSNLMREVGEAARRLDLPHVASLYETLSNQPAGVHHCDVVHSDALIYADRWSEILNAPARRIMPYVPERYFDLVDPASAGGSRAPGWQPVVGIFGSVQPRKGQLEAVEAIGLLKKQLDASVELRLFGYDHFNPAYVEACKKMASGYGVSNLVSFSGFVTDTAAAMRGIDVVLCASDCQSPPQAILEAMAAGRLVIGPSAGGIGELVCHGSGVAMPDSTSASIFGALATVLRLPAGVWRDKTNLAREVVRQECSRYSVAAELFRLYRQAACGHIRARPLSGTIAQQDPEKAANLAATHDVGSGWQDTAGPVHSGLRWLADKSRHAAKLRIFRKPNLSSID